MKFDLPKDQSSIIKVIGVGGGGGNAVNHMYNQGIKGVDFIVCNTDAQALDVSPVPTKIQLGASLTEGRGAGSIPEVGRNAAIEDIDDIREVLEKHTKMVFVTAGMGGGTGTGAAPVIAQIAKEMGILTVGIVTVPFAFEGRKRKQQAENGLESMRQSVDTLLVINNDRLREMYGNLTLVNAFSQADDVLTIAAKGIAEVISVTGAINVDFNDVNTVMKNSGVAIMGSAKAEGENRSIKAVEQALASPLLNDNDITGATYVLLNITYGSKEVLMDEISEITDYIQDEAGSTADVIWGHCYDETLGDALGVTIIATGFNSSLIEGEYKEPKKRVLNLEDEVPTIITKPIENPTQAASNAFKFENEISKDVESTEEPYLKSVEDKPSAQASIEFEINSAFGQELQQETAEETNGEVKRFFLEDDTEANNDIEDEPSAVTNMSQELLQKRAAERINKIKELSGRLKTPSGLSDMENEPAYKRRNINLDDTPHSSESNISRYTLSDEEDEDGEKRSGLRGNNSFLHDNVD